MTRTTYFTASSLDGFIATPDHSLDWLLSREQDPDRPLGYHPFIARIGALAMGATTYDWVREHLADQPWPYAQPTWVFTHRDRQAPPDGDVRMTQDDVRAVHAQMVQAAAGKDVWIVGGGDLAGQFADCRLLDELIVSVAPVTLGAGAPLLPRQLELVLREIEHNGELACARYEVVSPRP